MNGKNSTRFIAENVRVTRVNRFDKVAFVTVLGFGGRGTNFIDITDFALPADVAEGQSVTITGDVSMRKPQNGGGKWTIQLVARKWIAGKEDMTAPMPEQRAQEAAPVDDSDIPF